MKRTARDRVGEGGYYYPRNQKRSYVMMGW